MTDCFVMQDCYWRWMLFLSDRFWLIYNERNWRIHLVSCYCVRHSFLKYIEENNGYFILKSPFIQRRYKFVISSYIPFHHCTLWILYSTFLNCGIWNSSSSSSALSLIPHTVFSPIVSFFLWLSLPPIVRSVSQ